MDGQLNNRTDEQLKADIIAKQNAQIEKILGADPSSSGKLHSMYESSKLGLFGFICTIIAAFITPSIVVAATAFAFGPSFALAALLAYLIITIIVGVWALFDLKGADHTRPLLIGVFAFCIVSPLELVAGFFVGIFGGITVFVVTAILVYIVLSHYDWV